jgi:CRP-like cAMP-binding protein
MKNIDSDRSALLKSLPIVEKQFIQNLLQLVELQAHEVLMTPGSQIKRVIFPIEGLVSILAVADDGARIEVGIIGREGVVGTSLLLEVDRAPYQAIVHVGGRALSLSAEQLIAAAEHCPHFKSNLLHFVHVFGVQIAQTALCNGSFTIQKRLARWLLMCEDRLQSSRLHVTHEFLSLMLAVRRSGVTVALQELEGMKIIKSTRGKVEILNREALRDLADGAYGTPEAEYERLIPSGTEALVLQ